MQFLVYLPSTINFTYKVTFDS